MRSLSAVNNAILGYANVGIHTKRNSIEKTQKHLKEFISSYHSGSFFRWRKMVSEKGALRGHCDHVNNRGLLFLLPIGALFAFLFDTLNSSIRH